MLDAIRAEALKFRAHRATWMMVWIFPIAVALLTLGGLVYGALTPPGPPEKVRTAAEWIKDSAFLWRFPTSAPGLILVAGFTTLVFAGEYGWNTWKLVIPARARWQLIAAKWIVAFALLLLAYIVADLIGLLATWAGTFQGEDIPAGVTLSAILDAHLNGAGHALLPVLYTIAFAGLFAILTRSTLATAILSIALIVAQGLMPTLAIFLYPRAPALIRAAVEVLPMFHLINLAAWAKGAGFLLPLDQATMLSVPWSKSLAVVAAWTLAAAALTQLRFQRQDLN